MVEAKERLSEIELKKIWAQPRFLRGETTVLAKPFVFTDGASFYSNYHAIFNREEYRFNTLSQDLFFIDCGAYIGLSVVYLKECFPFAKIVAFEPAPKNFDALKINMETFQYTDVELIQAALWNKKTKISFMDEGADGGRIAVKNDTEKIVQVDTVLLSEFIDRKVDFLKIDIEGAETKVLLEIEPKLKYVERLFVEYHGFYHQEQTLDVILRIMKENGFRYHIHSEFVSQQPFIERRKNLSMDLQLNIFAFRED